MSGSANLPIRIAVEGAPQAEATFNRVGQAGQAAMQGVQRSTQQAGESTRNFGHVIGQAGFQVQDFAVQVQSGQSALTALSQQGSQLLGVFGTGGAIAGAALTVGILGYQLLGIADNGDDAAKAIDELGKAMDRAAADAERVATLLGRVQARFVSVIEASRNAQIREIAAQGAQLGRLGNDALLEETNADARARQLRAERESVGGRLAQANDAVGGFGSVLEPLSERERAALRDRLREIEGEIEAAEANADNARRRRLRFDFDRQRLEGLTLGLVQDGAASVNAGRADDRGGGTPRPDRGGAEATLQQLRWEQEAEEMRARAKAEATSALDEYNQRQNLANAGLERASGLLQAYERDQRMLSEALRVGIITEEEFGAAVAQSSERLAEQMDALQRRTEDTSRGARELGFAFQSAFEDAILQGRDVREVFQGIAQDIARITLRRGVTEPLSNAFAGSVSEVGKALGRYFSGSGGLNALPSTGGISANPFGFADGGIMTAAGPLPLNRYASGGIATSPQLALFGEGRGPEAYVPLPDGRSIPVTMRGGGGNVTVNLAVDARGASDPGLEARLYARLPGAIRAAMTDYMQRGGSFATTVRGR